MRCVFCDRAIFYDGFTWKHENGRGKYLMRCALCGYSESLAPSALLCVNCGRTESWHVDHAAHPKGEEDALD